MNVVGVLGITEYEDGSTIILPSGPATRINSPAGRKYVEMLTSAPTINSKMNV